MNFLSKNLLGVFARFAKKLPEAALEPVEPDFIVGTALKNVGWSKGNEYDPQSATFTCKNGDLADPAIVRLLEIAEIRGLQAQSEMKDKGAIRLFISGEGAFQLACDFSDAEDAAFMAETEATQLKSLPLEPPSHIKWPGKEAKLHEHLQYLIDVREFISQMNVPEGLEYLQFPHSDAPCVGDKTRPAVLDASYDYRFNNGNEGISGRVFASISIPDFTPVEKDRWESEQYFRAQGLSVFNINDSFKSMLEKVGVEIEDGGKIGVDRMSGTCYFEYTIHPADYERARAVIDAYIRSDIIDGAELLEHIKKGDRVREFMDIPGARVDFNEDGTMRVDVPLDYDLDDFKDVGIYGAESFEQITKDMQGYDVRPGYKGVIVPAQKVPHAFVACLDPDQSFATRSLNAPDGPIAGAAGCAFRGKVYSEAGSEGKITKAEYSELDF